MLDCNQATTRLEALNLLRETFLLHLKKASTGAKTPAEAKDALVQAQQLKAKLETDMIELSRELAIKIIVVPNAVNPYAEGLKEAGLPASHIECQEKKEITLDLEVLLAKQCALYAEQGMDEWVVDIQSNQDILVEICSDPEQVKRIEARIKEGMVPVVMPSRQTQMDTWRKALTNLKPVWIKTGTVKPFISPYIYDKYPEKMTASIDPNNLGFFRSIPERPYIVWSKADKKVATNTTNKTFAKQQEEYQKMVRDNPLLYDVTDTTPLEYVALQSNHTVEIDHQAIEYGVDSSRKTITPLDDYNQSYCRFLSAGPFSGGDVPFAYFNPVNSQLGFGRVDVGADSKIGFRPAAMAITIKTNDDRELHSANPRPYGIILHYDCSIQRIFVRE